MAAGAGSSPSRGLDPISSHDLRRRLGRILELAERSVLVLAVDGPGPPGDRQAYRKEKFICETALLVYATAPAAASDPELGPIWLRLARRLVPYARSEDLLTRIRMRPTMAPELSVAHACLTRAGLPDTGFDALLMDAVAAGYLVPERAAWKDIEAAWLSSKMPGFKPPADLDRSIGRTTLATGLDALSARREELYAFTHALIYLSDFGFRELAPPRAPADLFEDAEAALARCLDDDDFDLCAELLFTWPYLRAPLSPIAGFGLDVLRRVEDDVGFLPSLSLSAAQTAGLDDAVRQRAIFDEAYHTAFVMGLLAAALLLPQACLQPVPQDGVPPGAAKTLMALMPPRTPVPQWERDLHALDDAAQDQLATLLATIALRRALAGHDLRLVREIVSACIDLRLFASAAAVQAGELLRRFTPQHRPEPAYARG
ncbi:DUF6895 family protein [Phenylobacterium sp.]|jgi:hypothetical protein|uniref:DUF6895 family protein n=1 Tax=Phenylobacterium sp. TaxID=1871053 RepID=UPI0037C59DE7